MRAQVNNGQRIQQADFVARRNVLPLMPWFDSVVMFFLPLIFNISLVSHDKISRLMISFLFVLLLFKNLVIYPALSYRQCEKVRNAVYLLVGGKNPLVNVVSLFLLLMVIAELRGVFSGAVPLFSFLGLAIWSYGLFYYAVSVYVTNTEATQRRLLIGAYCAGLGLFVVANFIGHIAGFRGVSNEIDFGQNKILSWFGILTNRTDFPFALGLNGFGIMAGLCLVVGALIFLASANRLQRLSGAVLLFLGVAGVAMADTRAIIVVAVIAIGCVVFCTKYKWISGAFSFFPYILPFIPLIVVSVLYFVDFIGFGQYLQREGDFANRLGLASGRDAIWIAVFTLLLDFDPIQLIGYGAYGQYVSGLTKSYSWVFSQIGGQTSASLHNATLQILIDMGYVGLCVWLVMWVRIVRALRCVFSERCVTGFEWTLAGVVLLILFGGFTEVAGTIYKSDAFGVFLVALAALASKSVHAPDTRK